MTSIGAQVFDLLTKIMCGDAWSSGADQIEVYRAKRPISFARPVAVVERRNRHMKSPGKP